MSSQNRAICASVDHDAPNPGDMISLIPESRTLSSFVLGQTTAKISKANDSPEVVVPPAALERPAALQVNEAGIPDQLKKQNQWCCWRHTPKKPKNGEITFAKVPYQPDGRPASTSDPLTWCNFEQASLAYMIGSPDGKDFDGLGFVFTSEDDFVGIDVDKCRDPITEQLGPLAQEVLDSVDGYAEVSPSGTGIKIFTRAEIGRARVDHKIGLEIYEAGRYFAVTGHAINGHNSIPNGRQDLSALINRHFGEHATHATNLQFDDPYSKYKTYGRVHRATWT